MDLLTERFFLSAVYRKTKVFAFRFENMPIHIYWKFLPLKMKIFRYKKKKKKKKSDIFQVSIQNIDCGYSLEPNEYPQSMSLSINKKKYIYTWTPQFYYIKVGFQGVKII